MTLQLNKNDIVLSPDDLPQCLEIIDIKSKYTFGIASVILNFAKKKY